MLEVIPTAAIEVSAQTLRFIDIAAISAFALSGASPQPVSARHS